MANIPFVPSILWDMFRGLKPSMFHGLLEFKRFWDLHLCRFVLWTWWLMNRCMLQLTINSLGLGMGNILGIVSRQLKLIYRIYVDSLDMVGIFYYIFTDFFLWMRTQKKWWQRHHIFYEGYHLLYPFMGSMGLQQTWPKTKNWGLVNYIAYPSTTATLLASFGSQFKLRIPMYRT